METITAIRNLRGEMNVPPAAQVEVFLHSGDSQAVAALKHHGQSLTLLAKVKELHFNAASGPPAAAAKAVVDAVEIFLPLAGLIDFSEEEKRLTKEIDKLSQGPHRGPTQTDQRGLPGQGPGRSSGQRKRQTPGWSEKLTKLKNHRERIKELMG